MKVWCDQQLQVHFNGTLFQGDVNASINEAMVRNPVEFNAEDLCAHVHVCVEMCECVCMCFTF